MRCYPFILSFCFNEFFTSFPVRMLDRLIQVCQLSNLFYVLIEFRVKCFGNISLKAVVKMFYASSRNGTTTHCFVFSCFLYNILSLISSTRIFEKSENLSLLNNQIPVSFYKCSNKARRLNRET